MSTALALQRVSLGYERLPAVRGLDVAFTEGSLTAIVGPNGAGKSTLLKGMVGELKPMEGRIVLPKQSVAYLPQQSSIDRTFPMTVTELVAMGLWRQLGPFGGISKAHRRQISHALAAVGLTGFEGRRMSTLSGGQVQRVLFARLLIQEADVLLLDEPFTAIDTRTASDLLEVIGGWHNEGKTVIAVLHDLETVRTNFPQTLLLARDVIAHGDTDTVLTADNLMRARQMCEACADEEHSCGRPAAGSWRM